MMLVNGTPAEQVQASDRGLMYGDGVFRTLVIRAGKPCAWQRHYGKLREDCQALGIACPPEMALTGDISALALAEPDCVAKIVVTRGAGARGYAPSADAKPTRIVMSTPLPAYPASYFGEGIRLHVCSLRLAHQPRLAGIKHLNRLENVLARQEWDDAAIAEGVLLDASENVIEGTMSNVFMRKGKVLHTPDLSRCGVSGVARDRIMALAPTLGMGIQVGDYGLDFLLDADEVVMCNSVIGAWQVKSCRDARWQPGGLAEALRKQLNTQES